MNNKKYKLTISLLASNRKDTLPKTLASLKPILDNVSSELIVVDTGCDEELLEIVRQYTDKIEKFEWCKDFSKARNVGIDKAQGDWFMFIDDDEWFEDTTEFIEFFNSDEMKKYNYGKYVVRNYENMEGTAWTDSIAGRMFRLFEDTKFIDAIHERPTNIAGPTKSFCAYAHHYGYVYKTEEDRRAHIKRNTELLIEQLKREPGCARNYCHLAQEYNTIKEYEKSLDCALEGIAKSDMNVLENRKDVSGLYGNVVWVMINQLRYEDAIKASEEYMNMPYTTELAKVAMEGFCATALYKLEKYDAAMERADKFLKGVEYFEEHPEKLYAQDAVIVTVTVREDNAQRLVSIGFASAIMAGDVNKAKEYIEKMHGEMTMMPDVGLVMEKFAELLGKEADKEISFSIINKLMTNQNCFSALLSKIDKIREKDTEAYIKIADIIAMLDSRHGYVQFMNIISKRNENEEILAELYAKLISDVDDLINLHHHFWIIADQRKISIAHMVAEKPMNRWMVTVDDWAKDAKIKDLFEKKQDLAAVLYNDGMHMKYYDVVLAEGMLYRKKLDEVTLSDIKAEMLKYTNVVMEFYRKIYKDEIFVQCPTVLPNRCQVAMCFMKVLCGEAKDIKAELDMAGKLMPGIKPLVGKYIELMG